MGVKEGGVAFGAERLAWGLGVQGHPTHLCNVLEHCVVFRLCRRVWAGLGRTGLGAGAGWERWNEIFPADSQNVPYFLIFPALQLWELPRSGEIFDFGTKLSHFVPLALGCGGWWSLRAAGSEHMFEITIGLCYGVRRGLARGQVDTVLRIHSARRREVVHETSIVELFQQPILSKFIVNLGNIALDEFRLQRFHAAQYFWGRFVR